MGPPQGVRERHVSLGLLRPFEERLQLLVLDALVRFEGEGEGLPGPAPPGRHTSRRRKFQTASDMMSTTQQAVQTMKATDGGDCTKNGFPARSVVAPSTSR